MSKITKKEIKLPGKHTLDKSFVEFVIGQIQDVGNISYKYMFGGCAIYSGVNVIALICNNQLYVRPTKNGKEFIKTPDEKAPYPGAKPHFLIGDTIDNKEWLCELIKITDEELSHSNLIK